MRKIIVVILILVLSISGSVGLLLSWSAQTDDMQSQEDISEMIADKYIVDIEKQYLSNDNKNETPDQSEPSLPSDSEFDYDDNEIYSYFDESYAQGHVDCVLEIPAIDLRQSVFTGDADQIKHDLSRWLPVTARTDYTLGDTQYCIYMHNPRNKSIKISMAQEKLKVGDYMVITQKNSVYFYTVTGVFSEWRNKCSEQYVNNDNVDAKKLYIFTCARNEWQGKNLVIEGTMQKIYTLADWMNNKDKYVSDYKYIPTKDDTNESPMKPLMLNMEYKNDKLMVNATDNSFQSINCTIGIFDIDGYLLEDAKYIINYRGGIETIPDLPEGKYYVGIYECPDGFYSDSSYLINVDKQARVTEYDLNDEINEQEERQVQLLKAVSFVSIFLSIIFTIFSIVKICISRRDQKEK